MVVEILSRGIRISLYRGFLKINEDRLPLEDIEGLIFATPALQISGEALSGLAKQGILAVFCDRNYLPTSTFLPYSSHTYLAKRAAAQTRARKTLKARLWKQIVRAKIENQASIIARCRGTRIANLLKVTAQRVRVENASEKEATAARVYWKELFGTSFRRSRSPEERNDNETRNPPLNAGLNWGYTVLRSALCRRLIQAALYPALGLHHHNQSDPFCLADDLIEPFRPLVDEQVFRVIYKGQTPRDTSAESPASLDARQKSSIAEVLQAPMRISGKVYPAKNAMLEVIQSLVRVFESEKRRGPALVLPQIPEVSTGGLNAQSVLPDVVASNVRHTRQTP